MDLGDLFGLVKHLDPRRRKREGPPPVVVRMPNEGEAPEVPAVRPRLATPPGPPPPLVMATGPAVTLAPDLGLAGDAPPMPAPRVGLVGGDVDPREAGADTRPRIADPLGYTANRVAEMEVEPPRKMGRWEALGKGALRGFAAGGLGGLAFGAGMGAADPGSVARLEHEDELGRERQRYADLYQTAKAQTGLEGERVANEARAATIPYLLARPEIEQYKAESQDAYRAGSLDLRRQANESLEDYRNRTLGQKKDAAESLEEYRDRMIKLGERRVGQADRRLSESERHNRVSEAQGGERIGLAREGLSLRERIASGNLDASWARIGQGYDRLDAARQKQVDSLAERAARAEAEAAYFEGTDKPAAEMRRRQAADLRRQAEQITNRPAPRVSRPTATPPVSEEEFVARARQQLGAAFDESRARAAYRQRYGR